VIPTPEPSATQEPRWRRLPEERPQQIIEAAFTVFGEKGLGGARLDDIAKRAGVSKGTIYLYFPNKEALFREMIRQTMVVRLEAAQTAIDADRGSPTEQLKVCMRAWWTYLRSAQYQTVFRLILAELPRFPDLAEFYAQEVIARAHRLVGGIIRRGIETREFRDVDPVVAARMLSAMLTMQAIWCSHHQYFPTFVQKSEDEVLADIMDFYLRAVRRAPDAAGASNAQ
jgi:AcrR family transcriptional regulator